MLIYYDTNRSEILTADEAYERALETIDIEELYVDELKSLSPQTLWTMLDENHRSDILNELIDVVLKEDFICRDFSDSELGIITVFAKQVDKPTNQ